jgi:hypothetical protein
MQENIYRSIAKELIACMKHLDLAIDITHANLAGSDRAEIVKPVADVIYSLQTDLFPLLVKNDPSLADIIHKSIPLGGWKNQDQ